jgi:hypothetical protein
MRGLPGFGALAFLGLGLAAPSLRRVEIQAEF